MEARSKDLVGTHIGQYRILKKIGAGGMGTVYMGEHILLGRKAAIKVLLPMLSSQSEIVDRFFKEARATSAITDGGVVQVFDFGYHVDGTAYIVMELLEGEALAERIHRIGRLPAAEALRITRQVAGALAAAHAAGIVHRDLKPENVFIVADSETHGGERAKLLDFGICKMQNDATQTQTGRMLGTPVYMSPEQCQGAREVDGRADIYSLGCMLFHMVTGRVPFDLDGTGDLIVAHMQQPAPVPSELAPELAAEIDEIVEHCLAKDPDDRFQSMTAVQHAIDTVLPALTPAPTRDIPAGLALGEGFKSNFDGNKRDSSRASQWFVEEHLTPQMTGEIDRPHTNHRSLAAILMSGVIVALIVAGVMQTQSFANDDEQLAAVMSALPTEKEPTSMPADPTPTPEPEKQQPTNPPQSDEPPQLPEIGDAEPTPEIQQPVNPPKPEVGEPDPKPEVDKPAVDKPEAEKPVQKAKPVQKSRPRVIRRPAPQPQPQVEDLYETR